MSTGLTQRRVHLPTDTKYTGTLEGLELTDISNISYKITCSYHEKKQPRVVRVQEIELLPHSVDVNPVSAAVVIS